MKYKICNKCKQEKEATEEYFYKDTSKKDNLHTVCKECNKEYRTKNKEKIKAYSDEYNINNIEKRRIARKNKSQTEEAKQYRLNYYKKHGHKRLGKFNEYQKQYRESNITLTENLFVKISNYGKYRENPNVSNEVQTICHYCGQWTSFTRQQAYMRLKALDTMGAESQIYCSASCKISCPTFKKHRHIEGFAINTPREVSSLIRKMCFELDNYECQICGANNKNIALHCHHILGYTLHPQLANDIENVITLCELCHNEIHKRKDCKFNDLKCKIID